MDSAPQSKTFDWLRKPPRRPPAAPPLAVGHAEGAVVVTGLAGTLRFCDVTGRGGVSRADGQPPKGGIIFYIPIYSSVST